MGKSSSQVVGYRYYAKFAAFIGNRVEKLLAINFDNRKWVIHDPEKHPPNLLPVLESNLFGENEGGVSGQIDIHFGYPDQEPNATYKQYFPLVSGYPYQSYLIFRGYPGAAAFTPESLAKNGFYLGNSGYMKEMLLWVKRIYVKNNGDEQWYPLKAPIGYRDNDTNLAGEMPFPKLEIQGTSYLWGGKLDFDSFGPLTWDQALGATFGASKFPPAEENTTADAVLDITFQESGYVHIFIEASACALKETKLDELFSDVVVISRVEDDIDHDFKNVEGESFLKNIDYILKIDVGSHIRISVASTGTVLSTSGNHYIRAALFTVRTARVKANLINNFDALDINPIHKIREILTDDTAMGKPESDVNSANFMKAADQIWDEGLGISWAIDEKLCIEAIEELCYHIEAGIRVNRQTGLYEMVLFRDDWFAEDEIHDISENKIKDLSLEIMNSDDVVNQLNVTYYDRERIKNSTFSVYENGSILTMGHTNAESVEFPYFMNMRNAEIMANWKLKQFSTPAWSGSFTTGWKEARKWNRYDLIRLPWSSKWNGTILVRIMKINLGNGTDNTVTIDFEEVIPYSGEMNTSIVVDAPINAAPQPPQPSTNAVFEAPYYLTVLRAGQTNADLELSNNPDIGYVAAIAAKPQSNSLNALLYTDGGIGEFEQVSRLDYCDILQLDQPIIETTASFTVTGVLTQTATSNNLILLNDELMGFVSFDAETKVLTVKRGVLDTIPRKHSSGSLFVFDLPDVAFDSTQYSQSEIVRAQVLTTTPSGIQEFGIRGVSVGIEARAIKPYPPANVKFNGNHFPETVLVASDLTVTWSHRNRVQQTGGEPLSWFESSVTLEVGVTYSLELSTMDGVLLSVNDIAADSYLIPEVTLIPNRAHKLKLWSVRDGFESYKVFEHNFFAEAASLILTANITKSDASGNTVPDADISIHVDTSLKANMRFDGSSISGKAEPGAVITIEIEE